MGASLALEEAVIISGPRRGEIVQLKDDAAVAPEVTQAELDALNDALDRLNESLDVANRELRAATAALRGGCPAHGC